MLAVQWDWPAPRRTFCALLRLFFFGSLPWDVLFARRWALFASACRAESQRALGQPEAENGFPPGVVPAVTTKRPEPPQEIVSSGQTSTTRGMRDRRRRALGSGGGELTRKNGGHAGAMIMKRSTTAADWREQIR